MLVGNNESTTATNVGELLAILIAMRVRLPDGAHPGLHLKPLDVAIGQVPAPYCPSGRHGRRI